MGRERAQCMSNPSSRLTLFPMPVWAHVPGQTRSADHARLAAVIALVPERFARVVPADDPALRYGLALNDAGFFWECHDILEAVWMAAPQRGRDRILLRTCIQVANANLKSKMQRHGAALRLDAEARAGLDELRRRGPAEDADSFAARFDAAALAGFLRPSDGGIPAAMRRPVLLGSFLVT